MNADRLDRPQLGDEAATFVRSMIISGELRTGDFIRPEQVSSRLDISTTPAREGLLMLRGEGFLELVPRRGFLVRPLTREDISDLFVIRSLVQGELAARAAANASPEGVAQLKECADAAATAGNLRDLPRLRHANQRFHQKIYDLANAPKLEWFISPLVRYVPPEFWEAIEEWPTLLVEFHSAVLSAIEEGNPSEARDVTAAYIGSVSDLVASQWQEHVDNSAEPAPHKSTTLATGEIEKDS